MYSSRAKRSRYVPLRRPFKPREPVASVCPSRATGPETLTATLPIGAPRPSVTVSESVVVEDVGEAARLGAWTGGVVGFMGAAGGGVCADATVATKTKKTTVDASL